MRRAANALAGFEIGGPPALGHPDSGFIAYLHGELVGGFVDRKDGALHATGAAGERFDIIAAEIDAVDFPRGGVNYAADAFSNGEGGRIALYVEAVAVVEAGHAQGHEIVLDVIDDELLHAGSPSGYEPRGSIRRSRARRKAGA